MTAQPSLFDAVESQRRKVAGMARAAGGRDGWLRYAREVAVSIARERGSVCADDVRAAGVQTPPNTSANIWGSLFKDERFEFTGFTHSKRPEAHSNLIRLWMLR